MKRPLNHPSSLWLLFLGVPLLLVGFALLWDRPPGMEATPATQASSTPDPGEPPLQAAAAAEARIALQQGDPHAAIRRLSPYADQPDVSLPAEELLLLGDAYRQVGAYAPAVHAWSLALQAGAAPLESYPRLVEAHIVLGDLPALLSELRAWLALTPGDASVAYRLGVFTATERPDDALAYLAQAARDPVYTPRAQALLRAIRTASLSDDRASVFLDIGRALASWDEWEAAVQAFRHAARDAPTYADAWAFLGEALQHLAQPHPDPYPFLRQALDLAPDSLSANLFMALFYRRLGQYDNAQVYLLRTLKLAPGNAFVLAEMGHLQADQGDLQRAETFYRQAIDLSPRDPLFNRLLAEFAIKYQIQIRQMGLPAARQAVLLAPEDPAALDVMGQVLFYLDDLFSAEKFFRRALQARPDYAPAYLHLGQVYFLHGNTVAARQAWVQSIALSPDEAVAGQARRLLEQYFP